MAFEIVRNDITKVSADAIVNSANPEVFVGRGVDRAIYDAAGPQNVRDARREIGPLMPGEAAATPAFELDADYIIHTVGPVWRGGGAGERELVEKCYTNSLALAKELGCESIAFPLISTGTYRFPKDLALNAAVSAIERFLSENDMAVTMVVYDDESFEISKDIYDDVAEYIASEEIVQKKPDRFNEMTIQSNVDHALFDSVISADIAEASMDVMDTPLEQLIENKEDTFQEHLFRLIDRKGMTDPEVYKKANLDRKLFSKIRSNADYKPTKRTAVALAVALGLNFDETKDLLLRAGIGLSRSSEFDIIIEYCLEKGITNIFEINNVLFKFGQPILGG